MTSTQLLGRWKTKRTLISDLPEVAVELSEREMRIVSGGLAAVGLACAAANVASSVRGSIRTDYNTGGDHDAD